MILKCKMCGGTLEFEQGASVGVCDSCGTKQTLPKVNDEVISNLHNRANTLRLKCDFDKAEEIYNKILENNPEDAEAHWGIILCKYGIEYVEDPKTYKRIPTCHRTSYDAIMADEDYKAALQYGDAVQRELYEAEAKEIDRIQKDILAIVKNEKPFDVFICYKETDADGKRTQDSVIANDIYYQLTQEGFKVFYAAITLEDKLGREYEPYIFAALNSAKVMLVVGSKPEYFSAVWVKNEWSRFLKLMKTDRSKLLIPCYKDIDAYELPEEFAHLQAQDMAKIGFINDLVRGIKKVATDSVPKNNVNETVIVNNTGVGTSIAPLLKRAFMFVEDGEWAKADDFCEQVLNQDPENAEAYLGKLMAELHVRNRKQLENLSEPFDKRDNYRKALRFGDEALTKEMRGYITTIKDRNETARFTEIYNKAKNMMDGAESERNFKIAADTFATIPGFKDADDLVKQCGEKAEICRKDAIYNSAKYKMIGERVASYEEAINVFQTISGWKDADEQINCCKKKIEEIKANEEAERVAAEMNAKKTRRIMAIVLPIIAVCIALAVLIPTVIIPTVKYNSAVALMENEQYAEAITAFEWMDGHKDSADKIIECHYYNAVSLMDDEKYSEAISAFEATHGYKDSEDKIITCQYNVAVALMNDGKIIDAYERFAAMNGYKDSATKASEIFGQYIIEKLKIAEVGDIVYFGTYEQDNNTSNGKEDVEWIVLAKENGKALVISKYALDSRQYNSADADVTWENCSLRKWMNGTFLNNAFSAEEQAQIQNTNVSADKNPTYRTNPGNATTDKVFLLSITEAEKYFSFDGARQCEPTEYAVANGADVDSDNGNCWWWLRSPGYFQDRAAPVRSDGSVECRGFLVYSDDVCVRPALWINLDS